jgi:hypothetical protein
VLNMSRKDGVPEGRRFLFPAIAWWVKDCRMYEGVWDTARWNPVFKHLSSMHVMAMCARVTRGTRLRCHVG